MVSAIERFYCNYQKTLAEYARGFEEIKEELIHLKNTLHDIKQDIFDLIDWFYNIKIRRKTAKTKTEQFWEYLNILVES